MRKKVLIVEDEQLIAHLMEVYLNSMGNQVVGSVSSGEEAIMIAGKENPDCMLMDIRIDGEKDGIETALEINKQKNIPIIFVSGNSDEKTTERASKTNILGFLVKPVNKENLYQLLSKLN